MLLIFLPTILILACDSSSPAFHMMYSTCDGHEFEQAPEVGGTGKPGMLQSMGSQRVTDATERLN